MEKCFFFTQASKNIQGAIETLYYWPEGPLGGNCSVGHCEWYLSLHRHGIVDLRGLSLHLEQTGGGCKDVVPS